MVLYRGWIVALSLVGAVVTSAQAESAKYTLSGENTKVEFVGTKKDGAHTGSFKKLTGTATAKDTADLSTVTFNVTIDVDSMVTDDPKLTGHLKAPDFFEVKRYPEAKFVSTEVKKSDKGYLVSGDLTLHGVTKKVSFPAEITTGADGLKLAAKFKINRSEWGMSYGKGMIDDAVSLTINVAAKK